MGDACQYERNERNGGCSVSGPPRRRIDGTDPGDYLGDPAAPANAALVYYRAFLELRGLGDTDSAGETEAYDKMIDTGEYDARQLDPYVDRNGGALQLLLQAAEIEQCDFGVQFDQGAGAMLPELARARELMRLSVTAMRKAMEAGEWDRATDLLIAGLKLTQGVHEEGTLIGSLVAVAMIHILNSQAGSLLATLPPDAAYYDRIRAAFAQAGNTLADWSMAIEGERKLHATFFPPPGTVLSGEEAVKRVNDLYACFPELSEEGPPRDAVLRVAEGSASPEDRKTVAAWAGCSPGIWKRRKAVAPC